MHHYFNGFLGKRMAIRAVCDDAFPIELFFLIVTSSLLASLTALAATPRLKVSENKRFLVTEKGEPFFWLGDTAWELFHRLNREEATRYLENRAKLGFNVVQAVAIAELEGHNDPNPYGFLPLTDIDPARPAVQDGPDNDYWDHVDFIVEKANALGITIGFLPTWGRYWRDTNKDRKPHLHSRERRDLRRVARAAVTRTSGLVWIVGGDRSVDNDEQKEIIRAMARGAAQRRWRRASDHVSSAGRLRLLEVVS